MKFTLVHGGARDGYQVARALSEGNLLDTLITDLMWSRDRGWMRRLEPLLPASLLSQLQRRSITSFPFNRFRNHYGAALRSILLDRAPRLPFRFRQSAIRSSDRALGIAAGKRARATGSGLISYSYYGFDAFRTYGGPAILFQVHPHPASIRRILSAELAAHPDCAASLLQEWELSLPDAEFQRLVEEPRLASRLLCASSFTRQTLIENGADPSAIRVVPYGVDLQRFVPAPQPPTSAGPLKLLFVGRINQRKGIKYLLQALDLLDTREVEVTVCGRAVDGLDLFRPYAGRVTVRPSVSFQELQAAFQSADLFVLPSVAEGFGQVLLEALASGLPILSTTHTAAPDLITNGEEGFIVEPGRPDLLAEKIEWALAHRAELRSMRSAARSTASRFTVERFRSGIVDSVRVFADELYEPSARPGN